MVWDLVYSILLSCLYCLPVHKITMSEKTHDDGALLDQLQKIFLVIWLLGVR